MSDYSTPCFRNVLAGFLCLVGSSSNMTLLAQDEKDVGDRVVVSPVKEGTGDETLATTGTPAAGEADERAVGASGGSIAVPERQFGMDRPSPKHTLFGMPAAGEGDERTVGASEGSIPVPERRFGMDRPSPPHTLFGPRTKRLPATRSPKLVTDTVTATTFFSPIPDGSFSVWSTAWGLNWDGSRNGVSSWGFNAEAGVALLDPLKPGMVLEFENNYLEPSGEREAEAYIQLQNTDNTYVRPFQIDIMTTGARKNSVVTFTSTDFFSFMNRDNSQQRVKIYDAFALALNVPLIFTDTSGCAGCNPEVGLRPYGRHELAVITNFGYLLGNFRAAAVSATSLSGEGSAITNLNASNIRLGTLQDASLSSNVALTGRSNVFRTTQFMDTTGFSGMPGVVIRGTIANPIPNLSISSTVLPTGHDWRIASRGDNGALVVSNETDPTIGGKFAIDTLGNVWVAKDLVVQGKVNVQEGPNGSIGQVALQGGIATVTSTLARSTSKIFLTHGGAVGTLGELYVGAIIDGVSFEIRSSSSTDASPVNYWIVN
jgi:hypothetical protein